MYANTIKLYFPSLLCILGVVCLLPVMTFFPLNYVHMYDFFSCWIPKLLLTAAWLSSIMLPRWSEWNTQKHLISC